MPTPKGMRSRSFRLHSGDQVMVYSDKGHLFLQLRREVPTEQDILAPSAKVAVSLEINEALELAQELLSVAGQQLKLNLAEVKKTP
jgi:hypothetical protein